MAKRVFLGVLLFFEWLIINASEVVIMKLYVLQLRSEDVHLAAILKDDLVIEVKQGLFCLICLWVFDECLPDLGLFEDEYLDNGAMGGEELIEIVVGDDVAKLVVYAD